MSNQEHRAIAARKSVPIRWIATLVIAVMAVSESIAQEPQTPASSTERFALFETVETSNNSASSAENARNNAANRATRNTQAAPTFTLIGTSRIGNKQTALLKHLNGEVVRVPLEGNGVIPVPGHELYAVLLYGSGELSIRYPISEPCGDFPDQGVSCNSTTNIATLSLTTAEPIVANRQAEQPSEEAETEADAAEPDGASRNPFAALRDRSRSNSSNQATSTSRFQPRRINPADVPPGSRVVSTPFGDRLVEQQ